MRERTFAKEICCSHQLFNMPLRVYGITLLVRAIYVGIGNTMAAEYLAASLFLCRTIYVGVTIRSVLHHSIDV